MNLNKQKIYAMVRAWDDGVTQEAISMLFKVSKHDVINVIHTVKVVRKIDSEITNGKSKS